LWPAKRQRQAAVAQMQRLGAGGGLFLEGHPVHGVNGVYARVGSDLYEGWPRYECESGGGWSHHLFHYHAAEDGTAVAQWRIGPEFKPHENECAAHVSSKGGAVPGGGAQEWWCYSEGEWAKSRLTVRELTAEEAALRKQRVADTASRLAAPQVCLYMHLRCPLLNLLEALLSAPTHPLPTRASEQQHTHTHTHTHTHAHVLG